MESFAKPLRRLEDDAAWFARATELRLLHVTCSSDLRATALKVLGGVIEFHPDNRSPVIVLEDAWTTAEPGWGVRAQRMVEHWEGRVRVLAEEGIELGSLSGQRPASADPLGAFGGWLHLILQAVREPLHGVVLVLAPARVEEPETFEREVRELMRRSELAAARWVIMDVQEAALEGLHEELGERAMRCECVRDDAAFAQDLNALMTSVDPEMPGPAKAGAAWPRGVIPPPRPGEPPPPSEEEQEAMDLELAAAGANPALAGEQGVRMQQYMIAAAVHLKQGNRPQAVECQAHACRIAYDSGAQREALVQHLVLAGYKLAASMEAEAWTDYTSASQRAEEWSCHLEHAQANLALALMEARHGRHAEAAAHYGAAAEAARQADATGLAIESWRLAGQMAAEADLDERAAECFHRAIELAEGAEPEVAKSSSAPEAARQLAARLRHRGLGATASTSGSGRSAARSSTSPRMAVRSSSTRSTSPVIGCRRGMSSTTRSIGSR